ncbi:hypothetical protein FRC12_005733 [Ceratobasidium sp. 428]|nr:hypothetical protein FRC12_005733 [Ceratobasidium sp. 428]
MKDESQEDVSKIMLESPEVIKKTGTFDACSEATFAGKNLRRDVAPIRRTTAKEEFMK